MQDLIKDKTRARRRSLNKKAIERQKKIVKSYGLPVSKEHSYAKTHALTCGDSHCVMCGNPRKFFKQRTIQERKFLESMDEE